MTYLDLRLRLFYLRRILNYHCLVVLMKEPHKEKANFDIVKCILKRLAGESWNVKLLSAATDGAWSMVGRYQRAVALL